MRWWRTPIGGECVCVCVSSQSVPGCHCSGWSGLRGERSKLYMAKRVSSGLSGFLRLGVPCAAPGSPLGGDGRLGAISAALARSSRNLSNSGGCAEGKKIKERWNLKVMLKSCQNAAEQSRKYIKRVASPSLVTPSSPSSPFCWKESTPSHIQEQIWLDKTLPAANHWKLPDSILLNVQKPKIRHEPYHRFCHVIYLTGKYEKSLMFTHYHSPKSVLILNWTPNQTHQLLPPPKPPDIPTP